MKPVQANEVEIVEPLVRDLAFKLGNDFTVVSSASIDSRESDLSSVRPDVVVFDSKKNPIFALELKGSTNMRRLPLGSVQDIARLSRFSQLEKIPVMFVTLSQLSDYQRSLFKDLNVEVYSYSNYNELISNALASFRLAASRKTKQRDTDEDVFEKI